MSTKTFDPKCKILALAFLADEVGITPEQLEEHGTKLAGEVQQLIEDYIRYDFRGEPLNPPSLP